MVSGGITNLPWAGDFILHPPAKYDDDRHHHGPHEGISVGGAQETDHPAGIKAQEGDKNLKFR